MTAIAGQGVVIRRGDSGSPENYQTVGEVVSFSGPGGQANVIDVTNLSSSAIEKLMGLPDEGQLTLEVNFDPLDTNGQVALRNDRAAQTLISVQIVFTDTSSTRATFNAYVLGFQISGAVNDKISATITLEITGALTWDTDA